MAFNARITARLEGNPVPRPAQPMLITPLLVGAYPQFAVGGGPYDETQQFANAGYDFYRYNFRPDLPARERFQISQGEVLEEWWRRIQSYTTELGDAEGDFVVGIAVANMRPAWYADP